MLTQQAMLAQQSCTTVPKQPALCGTRAVKQYSKRTAAAPHTAILVAIFLILPIVSQGLSDSLCHNLPQLAVQTFAHLCIQMLTHHMQTRQHAD